MSDNTLGVRVDVADAQAVLWVDGMFRAVWIKNLKKLVGYF